MSNSQITPFSPKLQEKIDFLKARNQSIELGSIHFANPLLLGPMSNICHWPFRLLMEQLGCGGTISELISCHGINYENQKTRQMLRIDPREKNVGIQLFGEDAESMARAAQVALEERPNFIDINMGCPVRKVVTKGSGSALLKDTSKLSHFFSTIKKSIDVPLTIKIRTGWDDDNLNAKEVVNIAHNEGVEFVSIHGRTRTQQYKGLANWEFLEDVASDSPLPIIGNGDLHSAKVTKERLEKTNCDALMLARGPLRNPFIFLETYLKEGDDISFSAADYWEVIKRFHDYIGHYTDRERTILVQMRKHIVWFAAGFQGASTFRGQIFKTQGLEDTMKYTEDYFLSIQGNKKINPDEAFMTSGHG